MMPCASFRRVGSMVLNVKSVVQVEHNPTAGPAGQVLIHDVFRTLPITRPFHETITELA